MIREWCRAMTNPTLVTIDVLKNVRPVASNGKRDYDADYEALSGLKPLVQEFPGLSIMGAHPDRKMAADDVFDTFSGTLGLTGVVDCLAILKREKCIGGTTLNIRGRDTSGDVQKAVKFDVETCRWQVLGEASEVNQSNTRQLILSALKNSANDTEIMGATEIMGVTGLSANAVKLQLGRDAAT